MGETITATEGMPRSGINIRLLGIRALIGDSTTLR